MSMRLATSIEEQSGQLRYVVATTDPVCHQQLPHMGYLPAGDDRFATCWLPASAQARRYYERFADSIELMVLPRARLVCTPWQEALLEFLSRIQGTGITWWLYGSAALAVRGVEVEPRDIDVNVSDCRLTGQILDDLLVTPVEQMCGWVAECAGRAFSHAIIEWLSEPFAQLDDPDAPHEQGPFIAASLEKVYWCGKPILVPPLSAQLRVCKLRGLDDRVELIHQATRSAAP